MRSLNSEPEPRKVPARSRRFNHPGLERVLRQQDLHFLSGLRIRCFPHYAVTLIQNDRIAARKHQPRIQLAELGGECFNTLPPSIELEAHYRSHPH